MSSRLELHAKLLELIGNKNVYYQPPESLKMNYPCIVYTRNEIGNKYASNNVYKQDHEYQVTVIDKNPDSEIVEKMSKFCCAKYIRHFTSDNLNHDVFTINYK